VIVVQAPLRISFLGGGTDFPGFYGADTGHVLSCTIDKSIFAILKGRFDDKIRVGYTRTELVDDVESVEHDLVREALRLTGVTKGVELATMADIPSHGSGLGSSAAVTVALLHALWQYRGVLPSREQLAAGATEIEMVRLGRPIGVQDQYASAYGGLRFMTFGADGVKVEKAAPECPALARRLGERLMLFYTGVPRDSAAVLEEQQGRIDDQRPLLREMAALAVQGRCALQAGDHDALGDLLHEGWERKRRLASGVTNDVIDALYATARHAGAVGGKIAGAGGGGFLLLYCQPERQASVRSALHGLAELEFHLEDEGSLVMLDDRRR